MPPAPGMFLVSTCLLGALQSCFLNLSLAPVQKLVFSLRCVKIGFDHFSHSAMRDITFEKNVYLLFKRIDLIVMFVLSS